MTSLPPLPRMMSSPSVPRITSSLGVPCTGVTGYVVDGATTIVGALPSHDTAAWAGALVRPSPRGRRPPRMVRVVIRRMSSSQDGEGGAGGHTLDRAAVVRRAVGSI